MILIPSLLISLYRLAWAWIEGTDSTSAENTDHDEGILGGRHSVMASMSKSKQILYLFGGKVYIFGGIG